MFEQFKEFLADETGAVTVDWVVLTAALCALGMACVLVIIGPMRDRGLAASAVMESYEINAQFDDQAEVDAVMAAAASTLQ